MVWPRRFRSLLPLLIGGAVACVLIGRTPARGQSGARSMHAISTGGGASAVAPPTAALYTNPAHLGVGPQDAVVELRIVDVRSYAGGDLFQFQHYEATLASGRSLMPSQVNRQLDSWFGDQQRSGAAYASFVPITVTYRPQDAPWALGGSLRFRGVSETSVNRGFLDLLLRGTGSERTVPVDGRYTAFSSVDLTGAFSYTFDTLPLTVGIAPRLILGTGFSDGTLDSEVTVGEEAVVHTFDYTARAAGSVSTEVYDAFNAFESNFFPDDGYFGRGVNGVGMGFDLGASYEVQPGLYVSASVTDVGTIQWSGDAQTVTPEQNEFRFEGLELNLQRLRNEFDGDVLDYAEHQVDSLARAAYQDVQRDRSGFSSGLPAALNVDGTWDRGRYTLNGGATVGLNSEAGAVSPSPAVYAGGEVRLGLVPLRAGLRFGGNHALTLAGGLGLYISHYRFDIGASVTPSTSALGAGARYAIGLSLATVRF